MDKAIFILGALTCASSVYARPVPDSGSTATLGLAAFIAIIALRKFLKK